MLSTSFLATLPNFNQFLRLQYGAQMRGLSDIQTKPEENKEKLNIFYEDINFSNSTELQSIRTSFTNAFRGLQRGPLNRFL